MKRDKIPRSLKPDLFKDQDFPEIAEMLSYRLFCGKCGSSINPEELSKMMCFHKHDLIKFGLYKFAENEETKEFFEGWER